MSIEPPCTCGHVRIGGELTGARNWNPDCAVHGLGSHWYRSPEQVAKRAAQNDRLRDLQAQARAARERVKETG